MIPVFFLRHLDLFRGDLLDLSLHIAAQILRFRHGQGNHIPGAGIHEAGDPGAVFHISADECRSSNEINIPVHAQPADPVNISGGNGFNNSAEGFDIVKVKFRGDDLKGNHLFAGTHDTRGDHAERKSGKINTCCVPDTPAHCQCMVLGIDFFDHAGKSRVGRFHEPDAVCGCGPRVLSETDA